MCDIIKTPSLCSFRLKAKSFRIYGIYHQSISVMWNSGIHFVEIFMIWYQYHRHQSVQFGQDFNFLTKFDTDAPVYSDSLHLHKFLFLQTRYLYFQVGYCCIRIKSISIPYLPPQLRVGVIEKDLHKNSFEQKTVFSDWHNQSSLSLI